MSDALATLRSALTPAKGMRRIPFPTESYEHPSRPLSAKRLLNLMAESAPADARSQAVLIPTPGLSPFYAGGTGPILAINNDMPGIGYFVSGDHAFQAFGGVTDLGAVGLASPAGGVNPDLIMGATIATSTSAVVICIPPNAWTGPHDGPLNQIGGTFPGANSVTYIGGYFVFSQQGYGEGFFISAIDDPTLFDALDFASLEAGTNIMLRAITQGGELWLGGPSGWEVWYLSGDADFPFRRRQTGGVISYGIGTPRTIGQIDGSVFWLGLDSMVYRSTGYQATRISTHAVESIINSYGYGVSSNAVGMCYIHAGHAFYVLTIAGDRTLVYDCATKAWHDRASSDDGSGRWRPSCAAALQDFTLVGDSVDGLIYLIDHNTQFDNTTLIPRQFTMPTIFAGTNRAFENALEIEMEVGTAASSGDVLLEWSDDGGTTWTGSRTLNAGAVGELRKRVRTTRLGSFHQRTHRITAHGRPSFYGVDADITGPPQTSGG
jgi:hypothetical protein